MTFRGRRKPGRGIRGSCGKSVAPRRSSAAAVASAACASCSASSISPWRDHHLRTRHQRHRQITAVTTARRFRRPTLARVSTSPHASGASARHANSPAIMRIEPCALARQGIRLAGRLIITSRLASHRDRRMTEAPRRTPSGRPRSARAASAEACAPSLSPQIGPHEPLHQQRVQLQHRVVRRCSLVDRRYRARSGHRASRLAMPVPSLGPSEHTASSRGSRSPLIPRVPSRRHASTATGSPAPSAERACST